MAKRGSQEWRENIRTSKQKHGDAGHGNLGQPNARAAEYRIWSLIVQRCTNKDNPAYSRYGGRGITICRRWLSYRNFLADMGRRPTDKHSVERKNNDKGYFKANCVWLLKKHQSRNTSRTVRITFNGRTAHLAEWARIVGLHRTSIKQRLEAGWSIERALTQPSRVSSKASTFSK